MARKKKEESVETVTHPIFGVNFTDEDDVTFFLKSNAGKDKGLYLENAKDLSRPIALIIEADFYESKTKNFALTLEEAEEIVFELNRMIKYIKEKE